MVLDGWVRDGINALNAYQPSTNGLRLNGYKLPQGKHHPLKHGDEVQLAPETTMVYQEVVLAHAGTAPPDDRETYS